MILARRGAADTAIARLAVHADPADALAARLCVERLLGAIELRPEGLPPSAILCVRELRDPRPGTLSLASRQLGPPPVWEQAVRREVDRLARAAVRPARGPVPATAEAVVFADDSELLACLGSDLVAGVVGARWWWPLLIGGSQPQRRAAVAAWLGAPQHAPAALHALAVRGEAAAFVQLLEDREANALAAAIGQAFGMPVPPARPVAARASATLLASSVPSRAPAASVATVVREAPASSAPSPIAAPWFAVAPEADRGGLSIQHRALLGTALALVRAPALARSTDFAADLAAWRMAAAPLQRASAATERAALLDSRIGSTEASPSALPRRAGEPAPLATRRARPVAMDFAVDEPTSPARPAAIRTAAVAFEASPGAPSAAAGPRPTDAQPSSPSSPLSDDALANAPLSVDAPPAAEPPRWSPAAPHAPSPPPRRGRAFGSPIHTQLGGVFYLVNLALYLQLYGDGENLPLPLWDFVGSMARALLGEPFTTGAFANDPVWTLLAELAGRSADEPPGAGFAPPAEWRLPRAWLIPFTPGPVRHWIADGRLSIWHAEGFAIVDVSIDGDLGAQLVAELAAYAGAIGPALDVRPPSSPHAAPSDGAVAWVARLVPYVRARLRRALGIEDDEIVARLLVHTARVHATATHVDVVLPLDALPIEVRFAGLDRDPGWVPAAGRFIAFHFE